MLYPFVAAADPMSNLQVVDPVLTQLVQGYPSRVRMPSTMILRNVPVDNWTFKWNKFGTERFQRIDTERAMRAEIRSIDFQVTEQTAKLRRFSLMTQADTDELTNASPSLGIREKKYGVAKFGVELDIEMIIADMLTTAANYPVSHRLAIGAGSEWDSAGGDSRANIRSMAKAISADTGIPLEGISVFLTEGSYQAALEDPVFLGARQNYDTNTPNNDALRLYWGVKEVLTANPLLIDSAGAVSSMYGDVAILFVKDMGSSDWDTEYGQYDFAVNFKWNRGVALKTWFDPATTTWKFPFQDYASPQFINSSLGAIITNTSTV